MKPAQRKRDDKRALAAVAIRGTTLVEAVDRDVSIAIGFVRTPNQRLRTKHYQTRRR